VFFEFEQGVFLMPNQRGNYSAQPSQHGWVKQLDKNMREYKSRHPGLKPGMSRAEQDAYWDAYYAKHGYPFDLPAEYRK
jgi:hypothetical protein